MAFGTGSLHSPEVFRAAWQAGFRRFDTAVYYANDEALFEALQACGGLEEARVVHKVQPHKVTAQFERLIRPKLAGRPLDTLLLHHPTLFVLDASTERWLRTWRELEVMVERGLVRRIGLSNAGRSFVEYLCDHARVRPTVNQIECHPWNHDAELVRACRDRGLEVQCYSPLGGGRLALRETAAVREVAGQAGRSAAQVCLRWSIQKGLVPVVRASDAAHMRDNLEALAFSLDEAQIEVIDRVGSRGRAWDDPVKRGCLSAVVGPSRIEVPNRRRFAIRSALHYAAVEVLLRRRPRAVRRDV
jgi:diketogulonate reductase-like aldo/keto reductase